MIDRAMEPLSVLLSRDSSQRPLWSHDGCPYPPSNTTQNAVDSIRHHGDGIETHAAPMFSVLVVLISIDPCHFLRAPNGDFS